jgi:type VI secretion system ImpC/EvpB family protein
MPGQMLQTNRRKAEDELGTVTGCQAPASSAKPGSNSWSRLVSAAQTADHERLEDFLVQSSVWGILRSYLLLSGAPGDCSKVGLLQQMGRDVAGIDALISTQVNAIIHHPRFQSLEASWQGVRYLVEDVNEEDEVKIKILSVTKRELYRDLDAAIEFDQSQLYRRIYRNEFKMPGGEPFGILIGDYEFSQHPQDVGMLMKIAEVAALSFCPFIAAATPALFGARSFAALELPRNLQRQFDGEDYLHWQKLRRMNESMFLGLTLPRALMRVPYGRGLYCRTRFEFREDVEASGAEASDYSVPPAPGGPAETPARAEAPHAHRYLWGNAAYAFGHVVIRAFAQTGWLATIKGVNRDAEEGGLVTGLPAASFGTEKLSQVPKCPTELIIGESREKELTDLGFIPLCSCHGTEYGAFYNCPSLKQPTAYNDPLATANARVAAMLQYVLCASRFAHYINALARDLIGSNATGEEIQSRLNDWLRDNYVLDDSEADAELKAEHPLRAAQCEVRERPGRPGSYDCVIRLQPHYQLDALTAAVELRSLRIDRTAAPLE